MSQENIKVEAAGIMEKEILPPPPRKRTHRKKLVLGGIVGFVLLIGVIFYYHNFVAPYESTDDAFIDGYVTVIIRANVRVQTARQEHALDSHQQTVLTALEDTENALTACAKEQARGESLVQSVQANARALELSTQLYKSGLADFLRVLDSERSLCAVQDALVQSDQVVPLGLVQLYEALGGGWQDGKDIL